MKLITLTILVAITLSSCHSKKEAFRNVPEVLPGFTLIPGPNSLDKPGSIFAVEQKTGKKFDLGSINAAVKSGTIAVGESSGKKSSSVAAVLSFLGYQGVPVTADAGTNTKKDVTYKLKLSGTTQERLELLAIQKELEQTTDLINAFKQSQDLKNYKFYLITDAIKASKLNYSFAKGQSGDASLKAELDKVVNTNPKVTWDNSDNFDLSYDLQDPLYVYAKYFTLNIESQITGDTKLSLGSEVKQANPIYETAK